MNIKFFKREKKFKKESSKINPNFYWRLAVGFMFLAAIVSAIFGYNFFMQTNQESVSEGRSVVGKAEALRKDRLEKILEYFSSREQKSNLILSSPAPVADPSL